MKAFKFQLNSKGKKSSISVITFLVLLAIDIFIANIIFHGLSEQIQQLTQPYEYFPSEYKEILMYDNWVDNNYVYNLSRVVTRDRYFTDSEKKIVLHESCKIIKDKIAEIRKNDVLYEIMRKHLQLIKEFGGFDEYQKDRGYADIKYKEIRNSEKAIKNEVLVKDFISYIEGERKKNFEKDIKNYERLFALKRTLYGFLFLVPLLILLVFWNKKSVERSRELSIIMSSHFITVASLPVFFELLRLLLEVLPNVLLKTLYDFMLSLNIIAIWYYILIFAVILASGALVWFLQYRVFTQKRFLTKRIIKSRCTQCGIKVDYSLNFCPNCKNELRVICPSCNKSRIRDFDYCEHCGAENK